MKQDEYKQIIEYVKIYEYYDGYLSFLCVHSDDNKIYYGRLIDYIDSCDVHWIVPVTKKQIQAAEAGEIDVRSLMTEFEGDKPAIIIEVDYNNPIELTLEEAMNQYGGALPEKGLLLINDEIE